MQTRVRGAAKRATGSARPTAKRSSDEVRDYIADMAGSLAQLALASELESLAVACDLVRQIAQGNVDAELRLIRPS